METIFRFYKILNLLSIDVAIGAIISALFFAHILHTPIFASGFVCLGLTVWIIYTADHLLDAYTLKTTASTDRHQFHQKNFKILTVLLLIAVLLNVSFSLFVRTMILKWGIVLGALVLFYFIIQSHLRFAKEPSGAILYTAGILLPSFPITENPLSPVSTLLILQYFIIALINLILFSWFDRERDKSDNRSSLITTIGYLWGKVLLTTLFLIQGGATLLLLFISSRSLIFFVPLMMTTMLLMIFVFSRYFSLNDRFRYAGDAVFFVPVVFLAAS